ncbi:SixA phosphatase family protein [Endozoicomonas ascidiicola]|uniref:SixA phosphatase family protein n=1 Tax=Endozoicomonas ascidiicola TaxID=1698521 RepID=UPI000832AD14|nr:histidine phosphatase family protein [Endozoicomonas ascidiicola]
MQLIIMRHGEASWSSTSDRARVLTEVGRNEVLSTVTAMVDIPVTRIISSPYDRARETAGIAANQFGCDVETLDALVPEGNPRDIVERLPDSGVVLLASHMPVVSYLTGLLCDGVPSSGPSFQTAMAVLLEAELMVAGLATIKHCYTP